MTDAPHLHQPTSAAWDADVLIVGAGPSGMSAATTLAEGGCSVIVLDMQPTPGGQIFRNLEANSAHGKNGKNDRLLAALGTSYTAGLKLIQRFRAQPGIDYRPQTTVWEIRPDGTVGWLRGMEGGYLRAPHVILAHGAMERPTPFPGWTLPGVMTAGAVQTLLKAGNLKPEGNVVLAGSGPLLLLLAHQLRQLGAKPSLIARTDRLSNSVRAIRHLRMQALGPVAKGLGWLAGLKASKIPVVSAISQLEARGDTRVESVSFTAKGQHHTYPCDLLVVHDGIVPSIDLSHGAGLLLEWDTSSHSWQPQTDTQGRAATTSDAPCTIRITGDARRIGGAEVAIHHGRLAASAILAALGKTSSGLRKARAWYNNSLSARLFIDAAFPPGLSHALPDDKTIVCRCEELSAGALRQKIRSGCTNMDALRGETRCGMGPCQGRNCMITVARLIAEHEGHSNPPVPPAFRARPPLRPLPLGALANLTNLDPSATELLTLEDTPSHTDKGGHHAQA